MAPGCYRDPGPLAQLRSLRKSFSASSSQGTDVDSEFVALAFIPVSSLVSSFRHPRDVGGVVLASLLHELKDAHEGEQKNAAVESFSRPWRSPLCSWARRSS